MAWTGPFYLRTWDNKNDTSLGQSSGMLVGGTDPTSVLGATHRFLPGSARRTKPFTRNVSFWTLPKPKPCLMQMLLNF
ncbi:hypothetical protein BT69DRAFT_1291230 [Atractiella rhizophila]|nr:hypothetical protein BT69DRAFT_1291230 [Atractiella rhizophila]